MFCKSLVVICTICVTLTLGAVKFTNIKCDELNSTLLRVAECHLKVIGRGMVAAELNLQLVKKPVTNTWMKAAFLKRSNGYRPFLYNITVDFCDFMRNKKKYPVIKFSADRIINYTNINHTCPFDHDLIVHNLVLTDAMFIHLPLPTGDYMIHIVAYIHKAPALDFKVYYQKTS